jgi:hypothetical protein
MTDTAAEPANGSVATCACGALRVHTTGQPERVNACTCFACQKRSGSCFSYTAFFPDAAVEIRGGFRSWRGPRDPGRWHEASFCPDCGVTVFVRLEALPGLTGVSVGCFSDPAFQRPDRFYWISNRHHWLVNPHEVPTAETQ